MEGKNCLITEEIRIWLICCKCILVIFTGGSGGGGGAGGGQGSLQTYVGSPPSHSDMYAPTQYGGYGGAGGGSQVDLRCTYTREQAGGEGGMNSIQLSVIIKLSGFAL